MSAPIDEHLFLQSSRTASVSFLAGRFLAKLILRHHRGETVSTSPDLLIEGIVLDRTRIDVLQLFALGQKMIAEFLQIRELRREQGIAMAVIVGGSGGPSQGQTRLDFSLQLGNPLG